MNQLISIGRIFFAVGLCGIGVEHFIYQDFLVGRAPAWPEGTPGKIPWAYVTGILFIAISIMVILKKNARLALALGALLVFLWAFIRHIPVVSSAQFLFGEWTSAGKAITFIGGMLLIAATFPKFETTNGSVSLRFVNLQNELVITARIGMGLFLVICGIQHFMFLQFVATLIPTWFPGDAVLWSKFAGVVLIAGGIGLFIPQTARWAGLLTGIMIFLWVWIVHVPRIGVSVSDNIAVFEALAFSGIGFVMAGYLSTYQAVSRVMEKNE